MNVLSESIVTSYIIYMYAPRVNQRWDVKLSKSAVKIVWWEALYWWEAWGYGPFNPTQNPALEQQARELTSWTQLQAPINTFIAVRSCENFEVRELRSQFPLHANKYGNAVP